MLAHRFLHNYFLHMIHIVLQALDLIVVIVGEKRAEWQGIEWWCHCMPAAARHPSLTVVCRSSQDSTWSPNIVRGYHYVFHPDSESDEIVFCHIWSWNTIKREFTSWCIWRRLKMMCASSLSPQWKWQTDSENGRQSFHTNNATSWYIVVHIGSYKYDFLFSLLHKMGEELFPFAAERGLEQSPSDSLCDFLCACAWILQSNLFDEWPLHWCSRCSLRQNRNVGPDRSTGTQDGESADPTLMLRFAVVRQKR